MSPAPALVAVSHGTSSPAGRAAVAAFVEAVASRRPGLPVRSGFVDVQSPDVDDVLAALDPALPAVIVPLLLSAGYHVHVDIARSAASASRPVRVARALGPDDRLVELLAARLHPDRLTPADRVVLACAGSSDTRAVEDCREVAHRLAVLLGVPVDAAFISAATPRLADAVREAGAVARAAGGRVRVARYLLAPGYFADLAGEAAGDVATAPILLATEPPPGDLVDLVWDRYDDAVRAGVYDGRVSSTSLHGPPDVTTP